MVNDDTIKLLDECNAGVKMGVASLDEVMDHVKSEDMKKALNKCKDEHARLGNETHELLNKYNNSDKEPSPIAKGMSWMKTNMKLAMNESDNTIADVITDGCNMGIKSLYRYLNKYQAAEENVVDITKRLIELEENLVIELRHYL